MGKRYSVEIERTGRASRELAFQLLRDAEAWSRWAGPAVPKSRWEGGPLRDDMAVGRVRVVGTARFNTAEQITVDEPPMTHGYRILADWPVRDYSARVVLTEGAEGALTVRWSGQFEERIPGSGLLWRAFLRRFLGRLAENLLAYASKQAA
jgi:hypothetical protein